MIDVHPIFVHFPIALLTCYALFEIFLARKATWKHFIEPAKLTLLFLGTVSSWTAFTTGDIAREALGETRLVETHAFFAGATVWIFTVLSGAYLIRLLVPMLKTKLAQKSPLRVFLKLEILANVLLQTWIVILGSILGLITVTITGALGGAIVYGPEIDPIVSIIYHLFL